MPLDPQPVDDGNVVMVGDRVRVLRKGEGASAERYRSHFVSCPTADQHRRRPVTS